MLLNNRLNRTLAESGSEFRLGTEVFRDARSTFSTGNIITTADRAKGSIGADVLLQSTKNSSYARVFDLKTYGKVQYPISDGRQKLFLTRFGARAQEIFKPR